jgi:L-fuculose-phosphate aldolase
MFEPGRLACRVAMSVQFVKEREELAAAARRLAAEGLVLGTAGNVSLRAGEEHVVISPTGVALAGLRAEQVVVVDLEGRPAEGSPAPSSELDLHLGAIERFGAGAVVHTHSPIATALSCVVDEVPIVHYTMLLLGGAVPVAPYETFGTPELARGTLDALEGRRAALMASHGAVVHAGGVEEAVELALLLEWACEVYWRAVQVGKPRVLDEAEQRAVVQAVVERGYGGAE